MDFSKGKEHEMEVVFKYDGKKIKYFDLKQMISHLLGVGSAFLNGTYKDSEIHFIYLFFNPIGIVFENTGQRLKSVVAYLVVVIIVPTWKAACRNATITSSYI